MESNSILLIVASCIGFILIVVLAVFLYKYFKTKKEKRKKELMKHIGMKILDIDAKIREEKVLNELKQEKEEKENLSKDLQKIKNEKKENEVANVSSDLSSERRENNSSSVNLIGSKEKDKSDSTPQNNKSTNNPSEKIKENYSFLEEMIKSKIQEIVLSEGEPGTKRDESERAEIKEKNDIFRETEYSKKDNNSVYEQHKKDIEDHKDYVESEMSFRGK